MSIRSVERITGTHRDTIMRLTIRIGKGCEELLKENMKGFHSKYLQADEIWTFVGKKEQRLTKKERKNLKIGEQYIFVALDAQSKLIPVYTVGKRNSDTTDEFISELKEKLNGNGRVQITTDGFSPYEGAIEESFGCDVDFAMQIKSYKAENPGPGRYSPPKVSEVVSITKQGNPDESHISTALVESHNLTMRMSIRRLTRLCTGYSKKLENLKAAVALYFAHYNFMRIHSTIKMTPAMEANITDHIWGWDEVLTYEATTN